MSSKITYTRFIQNDSDNTGSQHWAKKKSAIPEVTQCAWVFLFFLFYTKSKNGENLFMLYLHQTPYFAEFSVFSFAL